MCFPPTISSHTGKSQTHILLCYWSWVFFLLFLKIQAKEQMHVVLHVGGQICGAEHNKREFVWKALTEKPNRIWGGQRTICWWTVILDGSRRTWTSAQRRLPQREGKPQSDRWRATPKYGRLALHVTGIYRLWRAPQRTCSPALCLLQINSKAAKRKTTTVKKKKTIILVWPTYFPLPFPVCIV